MLGAWLWDGLPVKVRPKRSSLGSVICLGVVVFNIESALGSISGNWASFSSWAFMLELESLV